MGNTVSNDRVRIGKPGERLSKDDVETVSNCLESLPVEYKVFQHVLLRELSNSWEIYRITKSTIIATAQEDMTGIYIVLDGQIDLISDKDRVVVASLQRGEFVGSVSVVFDKRCVATCRAMKDAKLLYLSKSSLKPHILSVNITMDEWLVKRMFLSCTGIEREHIARRIAVRVLQRVPLFSKWGLISLQMLVDYMRNPIMLFPSKSNLIMEGDPSAALLVILRGEVGIYEHNKLIQCIGPSQDTFPIWVGVEGLLTEEVRPFTLRAHSICQLIVVHKHTIESVAEVRTGDAGHAWTSERESCMERVACRDKHLYNVHKAFFQSETILVKLKYSNCDRFAHLTNKNLWHIATKSRVNYTEMNSFLSFEKTLDFLIFVLSGALEIITIIDENDEDESKRAFTEGELFDPTTLSKHDTVVATESTLFLEIPTVIMNDVESPTVTIQTI